MGCGKNGTFDIRPDFRQWAVLMVTSKPDTSKISSTPAFMIKWWNLFHCEKWEIILRPIEGHGYWDGKACFGELPKNSPYSGPIAVLTRASIRPGKLKRFWKHVDAVAKSLQTSPGFITSVGIGEWPWIKQATLSIWQDKASMQAFAYRMQEHAHVVRKTRQEHWYSEDLFVRFIPLESWGSLKGNNPLQGKL